ncbi:Histone-like transcription factor (CBF/NF-Y) and archaeal histone [Musa troglodytarum]|uniref:Histone-like transcription factor (CBF/NF-Y) and archaeal histone n=1 Tax=Musa troglodytarum TaxID=320322 RepID=A0A9E7FFA1_9LILI|nr:Histone-like transcription factor (CBF/NF-Y) and archaeal histone [Musa troglodytarum]
MPATIGPAKVHKCFAKVASKPNQLLPSGLFPSSHRFLHPSPPALVPRTVISLSLSIVRNTRFVAPFLERMDQPGHTTPPVMGVATGVPYAAGGGGPFQAYQHLYHQQQQQQQQQQQLQLFWADQYREIEQTTDFKNHSLPLARIKKIMKADEDVRMIAAEAPVVFARACEMFILELTHRSWAHAEENKRRTLQKNDIAAAISRTDVFDFLIDIVPREEGKEDMARPLGAPTTDPMSYYYVQQ